MKKFDKNSIDFETLESLSIYVLRCIGADIGVYLPTTLKKEELIRQIRAINNGEQAPYVKQTKRGRPPKNIVSLDSLVDAYFEEDETSQLFECANYEYVKVCESDLREDLYQKAQGDEFVVKGFFDEVSNGGVVVDINNKVCLVSIKQGEVKQYGLRKGDCVDCLVKYQEKNKPYRLVNILKINDSPPGFERFDFQNAEGVEKTDKLNFVAGGDYTSIENNILDCMFGDRVTITGTQRNQIDYAVINLLNNNNEKAKVVSLLVDCTQEQAKDYKKNTKNVVFTSFCGDFYSNHLKTTALAVEHVLSLCESGQNVIFAIPNLNAMVSALCNDKNAYYEVVRQVKELFMYAKNTNKNSLTIILGVLSDSKLVSELDGRENIKLLIHENLITNSIRFKYDILNSQRSDFNFEMSEVRKKVCDYLIKNKNSYESIKYIDSLMFENMSIDEFLNNLK